MQKTDLILIVFHCQNLTCSFWTQPSTVAPFTQLSDGRMETWANDCDMASHFLCSGSETVHHLMLLWPNTERDTRKHKYMLIKPFHHLIREHILWPWLHLALSTVTSASVWATGRCFPSPYMLLLYIVKYWRVLSQLNKSTRALLSIQVKCNFCFMSALMKQHLVNRMLHTL